MAADVTFDPLVSSLLKSSQATANAPRATSGHAPDDGNEPPPLMPSVPGAPVLPRVSLADLCEPLLLYVCRLSRLARLPLGQSPTQGPHAQRVKAEVQALLSELAAAASRVGLSASLEKVWRPLLLFVDEAVSTTPLPLAATWEPLAGHGQSEASAAGSAGGDFFSALDEALGQTDAEAVDRLVVFHLCLGLGYEGRFLGQIDPHSRQELEAYRSKVSARIWGRMDADESARITPDAYHYTDRRPLSEPIAGRLVGLAMVAAVLLTVAVAVNAALFFLRTQSLRNNLHYFNSIAQPAATPAGAELAPDASSGAGPGAAPSAAPDQPAGQAAPGM